MKIIKRFWLAIVNFITSRTEILSKSFSNIGAALIIAAILQENKNEQIIVVFAVILIILAIILKKDKE